MNGSLADLPAGALVAIAVVAAIQLTLDVVALVVLVRTPRERLQLGARWPWVLVILLVNLAGAIIFLAIGRRPASAADPLDVPPVAPSPPGAVAARRPHDPVRAAVDLLYPPAPAADPNGVPRGTDGPEQAL